MYFLISLTETYPKAECLVESLISFSSSGSAAVVLYSKYGSGSRHSQKDICKSCFERNLQPILDRRWEQKYTKGSALVFESFP